MSWKKITSWKGKAPKNLCKGDIVNIEYDNSWI